MPMALVTNAKENKGERAAVVGIEIALTVRGIFTITSAFRFGGFSYEQV